MTNSIGSINSGMSMPPPLPRSDKSLTDDQQSLISETLSEFDPENLSESDALSIIEAFSNAGIAPGSALEQAMADVGFDARTVGDLANVENDGSRPPPPKQDAVDISSMVEYMSELLEATLATTENSELSEEEKKTIYEQVMEKFGIDERDSIIDTTA